MKSYLTLNDIKSYKIAFGLSNYLWKIIIRWGYFQKNTIGRQYINAVDSISANIAEGFGRYGKKDKIKFYYYSLGSVYESLDWTEKSNKRKLIRYEQYQRLHNSLRGMPQEIKHLIRFTGNKLRV